MDPAAKAALCRDAYLSLLRALEAADNNAWGVEAQLIDVRDLLNIDAATHTAINAAVQEDPIIQALKRGEVVPGGRLAPAAMQRPPPMAVPASYAAPASVTDYSPAPSSRSRQRPAPKAMPVAAPPPPEFDLDPAAKRRRGAPGFGQEVVGHRMRRFSPDAPTSWIEGTITAFSPATGEHTVAFGPPHAYTDRLVLANLLPEHFEILGPPAAAPPAAARGNAGSHRPAALQTAGSGISAGKPTAKSKKPAASPAAAPASAPKTGGGSHKAAAKTRPPYSDTYLKGVIAKQGKSDDLWNLLGEMGTRERELVGEVAGWGLNEEEDMAEIRRLFDSGSQLDQRIQMARTELHSLGVA